MTRADCQAMDGRDVLAPLREHFEMTDLDAAGAIYLDGNSLGALPRATPARLQQVAREEWGRDRIRSWNTAGWISMAQRVGDRIAPLIGAGVGETVVADSTSVNLYKVLSVALALTAEDAPARRVVVVEKTDFPSDLYIAETLCSALGFELNRVEGAELAQSIDDRVAVVLLTHVNYRTGRMHPMVETARAVHEAGALLIWDLSHSVGAVPMSMGGDGTTGSAGDFAVGCGYKYLNGGPGAPGFLWVHPRHTDRMDREQMRQPLSGWLGHVAPFDFTPEYRPGRGIARFLCGTPPILSLAALDAALDVFDAAAESGGMSALRAKSTALTNLFIELVEGRCAGQGLTLVSPRAASERGSQVSFAREEGGYAIVQALNARGVTGDFRAPDVLRFGFTALYTRFVDVWDAVARLAEILESGDWRKPEFQIRATVT